MSQADKNKRRSTVDSLMILSIHKHEKCAADDGYDYCDVR